jgi:hypothetical protein
MSRKQKIFQLPVDALIDVFGFWKNPVEFLAIDSSDPLPDDAKVVFCYPCHERSSIAIIVESESFQDIPDGMPLPYADCMLSRKFIKIPFDEALLAENNRLKERLEKCQIQ